MCKRPGEMKHEMIKIVFVSERHIMVMLFQIPVVFYHAASKFEKFSISKINKSIWEKTTQGKHNFKYVAIAASERPSFSRQDLKMLIGAVFTRTPMDK